MKLLALLIKTMTKKKGAARKKYFTASCSGYKFLKDKFEEYQTTGGKGGISPFITSKAEIDKIYDTYSAFEPYSKSTFPQRFTDCAKDLRIAQFKDRARQGKFFFIFNLLLFK